MSDHVHDCPKCNGFWECDKGDCQPDDLCVDCIVDIHIATIAGLKAEVERLKEDKEELRIGMATEREKVLDRAEAAEAEAKRLKT
ncbi:MAG: hypothetical protein ABFC85_00135, partial [Rectinema sp.]